MFTKLIFNDAPSQSRLATFRAFDLPEFLHLPRVQAGVIRLLRLLLKHSLKHDGL